MIINVTDEIILHIYSYKLVTPFDWSKKEPPKAMACFSIAVVVKNKRLNNHKMNIEKKKKTAVIKSIYYPHITKLQ